MRNGPTLLTIQATQSGQTVSYAFDFGAYCRNQLILMAPQNGPVATYVFTLKAACGRASVGTDDSATGLTVTVLGNPVRETAFRRITGAGSNQYI